MGTVEKKHRVNGIARVILYPLIWTIEKYKYYKVYILGRFCPHRLASRIYKRAMGRDMNWDNPQDLNEKITWLKMNTDTSEWTRLADKYQVRESTRNPDVVHK